jgi:hypothetical protein
MTQLLSDGVLLTKEDKSGKSYLRTRVLENGEFQLVDIETDAEFVLQKSHLESLVEEGRFSFSDPDELAAIQKQIENQPSIEMKQSLDEQKRRLSYVEGALKADIPLGSQQRFNSYLSLKAIELKDRNPPSAVILYRWVKTYIDSNGGQVSLIPGYRKAGNRTPKVPSEHDPFINTVVGSPKTSVIYHTYLDKLAEHNEQRTKTGMERISPVTQESIRKRLKRRIAL